MSALAPATLAHSSARLSVRRVGPAYAAFVDAAPVARSHDFETALLLALDFLERECADEWRALFGDGVDQ